MKESVTDILDMIKDMQGRMDSMQETIDAQHDEICILNRKLDKERRDNRDLRKRLSKYEEPPKNSSNSSTPPSKENMKSEVIRRTKTLRKSSGKASGGQPGHEGSTLKKTSMPDVVEDVYSEYCTQCGESLHDSERVLDYVQQVISLPEMTPVIKELRHYKTICKNCGSEIMSHAKRKRGSNAVVYDSSVKSLVVYLSVVQFLPYDRIESFLSEVHSMNVSQGTMVNWVNQARRLASPIVDRIKECIMKSSVVGFDESGCYCNKRLDWVWIAQTVYFTLLFRGSGRASKELKARFGDSLERMTAVTDRHSAYFAINFLNHQVCLAHLLRELQYLDELNKNQTWSKDIAELLRAAIHERNTNPTAVIEKKPWLDRLDELLKTCRKKLGDKFETMRKGLIRCRDYIFNFLSNPAIPSDNNASERGIRKLKIKLKNSCLFRSDEGADAFLEIHSIVETAKKHNKTPFEAIRALFEGTDKFGVVAFAE